MPPWPDALPFQLASIRPWRHPISQSITPIIHNPFINIHEAKSKENDDDHNNK